MIARRSSLFLQVGKMKRIPVFYTPDHQLHHPRYEYDRGLQITYQEVPARIETALTAFSQLPEVDVIIPSLDLAVSQIERIHSSTLIQHLQERSQFAATQEKLLQQEDLYLYPWIYPLTPQMRLGLLNSPDSAGCFAFDTYAPIGKNTWQAVFASANLAYRSAKAIIQKKTQIAYALCRPPGHHAGREMIGGYCFLNNAAIAADQLKEALGRGAILDIDYHHGNGTQEIFWNDPDVLFVSIHSDPLDEYPFYSGFAEEIGGDNAAGSNLNLPLAKGCDDLTYLDALDQAISRIQAFQPNWLVLSAGYDTSQADSSTYFNLSDDVYLPIGRRIGSLQLPMVVVHEGGYAVEKNGVLATQLISGLTHP